MNSPLPSGPRACSAATTAVSSLGTSTSAEYVNRTDGVSWHGKMLRALLVWHWLNKNGCLPPAVCEAFIHCSARASGEVRNFKVKLVSPLKPLRCKRCPNTSSLLSNSHSNLPPLRFAFCKSILNVSKYSEP